MNAFLESPRTDVANFFKLSDNAFMGWIGPRDGKMIAKAPLLAFEMYSRHFGDVLVASAARSPTYDSPSIGLMEAVRGVPYLDVVASLGSDHDTLFVMAVNRHMDRPIHAAIDLAGFAPAANGTEHVLAGPSIDANTGTQLPVRPGLKWAAQADDEPGGRIGLGSPQEVRLVDGPFKAAAKMEYTFPPRSIICLEFTAAKRASP